MCLKIIKKLFKCFCYLEIFERLQLRTLVVQADYFNWSPPELSKYKTPLRPLAPILGQLIWDLVLKKIRGAPVTKITLYLIS